MLSSENERVGWLKLPERGEEEEEGFCSWFIFAFPVQSKVAGAKYLHQWMTRAQ